MDKLIGRRVLKALNLIQNSSTFRPFSSTTTLAHVNVSSSSISMCSLNVSTSSLSNLEAFSSFSSMHSETLPLSLPGGGGFVWNNIDEGHEGGENEGRNVPLPLLAVPKRKHSYSRKRHRQSNPLYQEEAISHIYPCPKCSKGLLKMRHHICPCDQDKLGSNGVVRISTNGEKGSSS